MTVQGERDATVSPTAEEQFTDLFRQYMPRVRKFIWSRLDVRQEHLADDLTQETFAELWTKYVLPGKTITKPFGLLCTIARGQLWDHFDKATSHEKPLDFADPVNTPIMATGHSYAAGRPDTALLLGDLENAMAEMRELSKRWQKLHKESYRRFRQHGQDTDQFAAIDQAEEMALAEFRTACLRVGELRSEIQDLSGPAWRSSTFIPERPQSAPQNPSGFRSDPTITHCPAGHEMTYQNTAYETEEHRVRRVCRACRPASDQRPKTRVRAPKPTTAKAPSPGVERARRMLADPAYLHLSVKAIAKEAHTHPSRLFHRLPVAELRQAAAAKAGPR